MKTLVRGRVLTFHADPADSAENHDYHENGAILINDVRAGFVFAGITFEEYRGQATDANGNARRFIAAGEAHAFPLGTVDTFATYFAPADFNETVGTLGQPLYARTIPDRDRDEWVRLEIESNPLPICTRPQVLRSARRT